MKRVFLFLTISFLQINRLWSHSIGGHLYRADEGETSLQEQEDRTRSSALSSAASTENSKERDRAAMFSTGWTSREVQYGVDQTGDYGAYTTELAFRLENLTLGGWFGIGTGNHYREWNFTVSYTFELGAIFLTPGYNFSYQRNDVEGPTSGTEKEAHAVSARSNSCEARHRKGHDPAARGQSSETYGNEIFFFLGTSVLPSVTPGIFFVSDVVNPPGSYLEIRLDGKIPVYRKFFELQPYVLLGINLGYNTTDFFGWNNFQFGFLASWKINEFVSIFGGLNYSVALTALQEIEQENEVRANGGHVYLLNSRIKLRARRFHRHPGSRAEWLPLRAPTVRG
jgi:hypothetical protein